jgi:hypothetical protein
MYIRVHPNTPIKKSTSPATIAPLAAPVAVDPRPTAVEHNQQSTWYRRGTTAEIVEDRFRSPQYQSRISTRYQCSTTAGPIENRVQSLTPAPEIVDIPGDRLTLVHSARLQSALLPRYRRGTTTGTVEEESRRWSHVRNWRSPRARKTARREGGYLPRRASLSSGGAFNTTLDRYQYGTTTTRRVTEEHERGTSVVPRRRGVERWGGLA